MNDSLSLILPVCNAQATLSREVSILLEVLPEVCPRFDLLILDDGSRDATEEIGCELATIYAQVRFTRHPATWGLAEQIRTALRRTDGDYLLLRQPERALRVDAMSRQWAARQASRAAECEASKPNESTGIGWVDRLLRWGQSLREVHAASDGCSGLLLYRREELARRQLELRDEPVSYRDHLRATADRRQPPPPADTGQGVPAPKALPGIESRPQGGIALPGISTIAGNHSVPQ